MYTWTQYVTCVYIHIYKQANIFHCYNIIKQAIYLCLLIHSLIHVCVDIFKYCVYIYIYIYISTYLFMGVSQMLFA